MSNDDRYIPRKEFDERMNAISERYDEKLSDLKESVSILREAVAGNVGQIRSLAESQDKQVTVTTNLQLSVTKMAASNRILWPIVTILVGVISALLGSGFRA